VSLSMPCTAGSPRLSDAALGAVGQRAAVVLWACDVVLPDRPEVAFAREQVSWLVDRRAGASFVASLRIAVVSADSAVVAVHVCRSYFGSFRLNLGYMTATQRAVVVGVRRSYDPGCVIVVGAVKPRVWLFVL